METQVIIRPAIHSDIFNDDLSLIANKVIFYHNYETNEVKGPYNIQDSYYCKKYFEMEFLRILLANTKILYVLDFQESIGSISVTVKLRKAIADDLKVYKNLLKYNYSYFIYDKNKVLGPFTIMETTSPYELKSWLDKEQLHVIDYADRQFNREKSLL